MQKDSSRYKSKNINIESLLNKEHKSTNKLNIDNLMDEREKSEPIYNLQTRREKKVRHLSPGEYIVVISMIVASFYLIITSFFPLIYNIVTSFEPINFLMNLFYFILGIGTLSGAFLLFKKETYLEHIADDTFDEVIYKRLEPVLRDVADVQVGLDDVHSKLEMMNANIEKMGTTKADNITPEYSAPLQTAMYVKYVVVINITLATFLFMLQYPLEYIPYAVTVLYIIWWGVITSEFKLWRLDTVWLWVFVPIITLPVATIIMNAYLRDYQMFGSLFLMLVVYVIAFYSWSSYTVLGSLPFNLHLTLRNFKEELRERSKHKQEAQVQKIKLSSPKLDSISFKQILPKIGFSMLLISIALFLFVWIGYSIEHSLIPNVSWENFGMDSFIWLPVYSYVLTIIGVILLITGFGISRWRIH